MPIATWERRFNVTVSGNRDTTGGTKVVGDGDIAMRNLIPTAIFATFCLMATEGDAKPTRVDTTRASVKQDAEILRVVSKTVEVRRVIMSARRKAARLLSCCAAWCAPTPGERT
jgi:hypothetical protein